jgi:hypothetical protein
MTKRLRQLLAGALPIACLPVGRSYQGMMKNQIPITKIQISKRHRISL